MCVFFFLLSPARFPFQREREIVSQVVHFPINAMMVVLVLVAGDDDDEDEEEGKDGKR